MNESMKVLDTVERMGKRLVLIRRHIEEPFWWIGLTEKQRKAVSHVIQGLPYDKIGGLMNINKSSVYQHVALALKKINDDGKVKGIKNGDIYEPNQLPAIILGLIKKELNQND